MLTPPAAPAVPATRPPAVSRALASAARVGPALGPHQRTVATPSIGPSPLSTVAPLANPIPTATVSHRWRIDSVGAQHPEHAPAPLQAGQDGARLPQWAREEAEELNT